jgi:hypothetical protein
MRIWNINLDYATKPYFKGARKGPQYTIQNHIGIYKYHTKNNSPKSTWGSITLWALCEQQKLMDFLTEADKWTVQE